MRGITLLVSATLLCSSAWAQSTNYVAYTGYSFRGSPAVAPGQIITLFVRGLNVPNAVADKIPLPTTLGGVTVRVKNPPTSAYPTSLPIFSVRSFPSNCTRAGAIDGFCDATAVTVQIPFEPTCISTGFLNDCNFAFPPLIKLVVQAGASAGQEFSVAIGDRVPHILNSCDALFGTFGFCFPLIFHGDGTLVSAGLGVPARPGETITLYAVGLGRTRNANTGQAAASPDPALQDLYLSYASRVDTPPGSPAPPWKYVGSGQWIKPDYAGLVQGFVGLYQINVRLPDTLPDGIHQCFTSLDTNLRLMLPPGAVYGGFDNTESAELCVRQ